MGDTAGSLVEFAAAGLFRHDVCLAENSCFTRVVGRASHFHEIIIICLTNPHVHSLEQPSSSLSSSRVIPSLSLSRNKNAYMCEVGREEREIERKKTRCTIVRARARGKESSFFSFSFVSANSHRGTKLG